MGRVDVTGGIANSPIEKVEIRVVRPSHPRRSTTEPPTVARPGIRSWFARSRNGIEAPAQPSGSRIECAEVATMRRVARGYTGDNHVFDEQGRAGDVTSALPLVLDVDAP